MIALALIETNLEPSVVYRAEYGEGITYVRPVSSWTEQVEIDGKTVTRFKKI